MTSIICNKPFWPTPIVSQRKVETRVSRKRPLGSLGPIARELWRLKDCTMKQLYHWNPRTQRYGLLSSQARVVLHDAAETVHGMTIGPTEYWLPQIMSEAIEAAEALGL